MLQESLGGGAESAASAKKALTHVQKLVQLASARPNALTLREFREALEESLKPEGSAVMKTVGFQLAGIAPRCSTHEVWRFILEAVVTELGNSENTSSLAAAISVLGLVPLPLVLGFLLSPEREPMNKLRSVLTHEDAEVRCNAIETLSKLTLDVAINVAGDGLFVFPFESHEARICCQQDVETMVNDCWKLIFHTLSVDGQSQSAYQPQMQPQFLQMCEKMIAALSASGSPPATTSQQYRVIEDVMVVLSTASTADSLLGPDTPHSKEIFDPQDIFLPRKHLDENNHPKASQDEEYREAIIVTGSADPVSIRISHHHPFIEKEETISLEVSCCNLTTWPLNDLEIQLRPLGGVGVVQCVDASNDLKLRLLRAGETVSVGTSGGSTSLPPFGVIKAEKRFRVCKFTQATFLVQTVLVQEPSQDGDDIGGANPAEEASATPIRLAFSNRYVLHFDTLLRLPQSQFATAAFFQHCWQSVNSSLLWRVKLQEGHGGKLSVCQHALHYMNAKIAAVTELLLELPMHFHIAMLTQTRWGSYVVASLTMSLDSTSVGWSGILEVRSTRDNVREFEKWSKDTVRLFGGDHVQLCSTPSTATTTPDPANTTNTAVLPNASPAFNDAFQAQVPVVGATFAVTEPTPASFAPDVRSTTSFHKDVSIPTDRLSSFARAQQLEQVRAPEATVAPDQQWGSFL
ncbi:uncharacterized protein IUM83_15477 [Phytophthora cinnamomi]|uniref:uncharacterized protein n=1 Tax=Phytophthora cinnamomi TaxID=4785 RepID=UPI00355AC4AE|nr:hypothetical protein IUM83_15477 [Phytophthora cinnamomi]